MDQRLRFVARLLESETIMALCGEFGIFRKPGHRIYQRYRQVGVQGLTDRSRRPHRHVNQLPLVVEKTIVKINGRYPSWGAPKIRERLRQRWPEVLAGGPARLRVEDRGTQPLRRLRGSVNIIDLRVRDPAGGAAVLLGDTGERATLAGLHRHAARTL